MYADDYDDDDSCIHRLLLCSSTGNEFQLDKTHMITLQVRLHPENCIHLMHRSRRTLHEDDEKKL